MQPLIKILWKTLIPLSVCALIGCTAVSENTEDVKQETTAAAATETSGPQIIEGTFVAPGIDFAGYRRLIVAELGFKDVHITVPAERGGSDPWVLTEQDKNFMRSEYTHAVVSNLIADGTYTTAITPADDVLVLKSRIVQIVAGKSAPGDDPTLAMYKEGAGTITIAMELYDSVSHSLIGSVTQSRDLGQMLMNNNRVATDVLIRRAFSYWLKSLRTELDTLSGRGSPLEQYLR